MTDSTFWGKAVGSFAFMPYFVLRFNGPFKSHASAPPSFFSMIPKYFILNTLKAGLFDSGIYIFIIPFRNSGICRAFDKEALTLEDSA